MASSMPKQPHVRFSALRGACPCEGRELESRAKHHFERLDSCLRRNDKYFYIELTLFLSHMGGYSAIKMRKRYKAMLVFLDIHIRDI